MHEAFVEFEDSVVEDTAWNALRGLDGQFGIF
jgi:hypothetical protein